VNATGLPLSPYISIAVRKPARQRRRETSAARIGASAN